ncbi:phosphate acyltransferase [Chelativorans sp. Marseille-P2723]|uniref:phosphate acyltransferase n=1 Tax=Chelativorans sp. Marseille-P2723 TaxID=2709133 RepID=UPI00156DD63D|nr:phosphate acyltransferase [Chelativorans sp. Marseille-P2723]
MGCIEKAFAMARQRRGRIVMPEMEDERIAQAAERLREQALAEPLDLTAARPAEEYLEVLERARPGLKPTLALKLLEKPLFKAAAMVAAGDADALIAGALAPTRRVIEAAAMTVGMAEGIATPSSFFLLRMPNGRELILADCAVNVAPSVDELCDIARATMHSAVALFGTARIALLSFSTGSSGAGASVDLVRNAQTRLAAEGVPALGPIQADAALNPETAARKGLGEVKAANVLLFPSLDAGNIAYKLLQELGGAQAVGPFLQGFARPVCDLSRGASTDDIVAAAALTMAMA